MNRQNTYRLQIPNCPLAWHLTLANRQASHAFWILGRDGAAAAAATGAEADVDDTRLFCAGFGFDPDLGF